MTDLQPVEYKLKHPFTADDGERIDTVTLRSPKAKDLLVMQGKSTIEDNLAIIARLGNLHRHHVEQMEAVDYFGLRDVVNDFLK